MSKNNRSRPVPALTNRQTKNFLAYVEKRGHNECWLWTAGKKTTGYGQFNVHPFGMFLSHRIAFVLAGGDNHVPEVMHICDNPPCCNPAHLKAGDHEANMRDMSEKGRNLWKDDHPCRLDPSRLARGEEIGRAKLTEEDVREIRELYATGNYSHRDLAEKFGVLKGGIYWVLHGLTWKHVAPELILKEKHKRKLSPEDVTELRRLRREEKWTFAALAEKFEITSGAAFNVAKGKAYQDVAGNIDSASQPVTRKLTPRDVRTIRRLCAEGVVQAQMAERYGVTQGLISAVVTGRIYQEII